MAVSKIKKGDKATAYHEAGHAVAAWRHRLKFRHVTIKPDARTLGCVVYDRQPKWFKPDCDSSDRTFLRGQRHIIGSFAGQLAEAKFLDKHPRYGMRSDNEHAVDMAFYFCGSQEATEAFLRFCWCVSKDLVNCFWEQIESLAKALLERETLNYDDAIEAINPGSKALRAMLAKASAQKTGA